MSAAWKESISLEETNKIRISLGLKPISAEPAAAATDPDAQAEQNYALKLQRQQEEAASVALKAKNDKIRNGRERNKRLTGVGLGAEDPDVAAVKPEDGVSDNKAWIKQQKKRAKEQAIKREKEQAEADLRDQESLKEYTEKDLLGIKVSHEADDFEEGEEVVLTLKDSRILDEEDDELHNLNIAENSAAADALALKKKGKQAGQYTGYDDEEFVEGGADAKASVLKKYDEEIEGKQESGFRLGGTVPAGGKGKGRARQNSEEKEEKERVVLSMDYTKTFTTDYFVEGEVGFKKPKAKKRKRATKVATAQSDNDESTPAPAVPSTLERINLDEANLVDDDDLQASLARSRREAAKKRVLEMKERKKSGMDVEVKVEIDAEDDDGDDVIVMDDTSEFVRNISLIQARPPPVKVEVVAPPPVVDGAASMIPYIKKEEGEEDDVPMTEVATSGGWGPPREDGEESDSGDVEMNDVYGGDDLPHAGTDDIKPQLDVEDGAFETTGSTETLVSRGMASTLNLLRHQGLLETRTPEQIAADLARKTREAWIWSQRRRDEEREEERRRAKEAGGSKDQGQREYENRMRDAAEARQAVEAFGNYEPVVDIKYHDEFGRDQTPKEAWKQLSHNFHGKGSGNMKTEKRLKKIAEEKKRLSMASGDTPLSSASAFAARAEKTGSAIMVLSVGNKGSAPMADTTLAKTTKKTPSASTVAKGKGKASTGESSVFGDIPMRSLPLPAATPYPSASAAYAEKRAGFAPIGQKGATAANGYDGTNGVGLGIGGGEKVHIPISVKRKAAGK